MAVPGFVLDKGSSPIKPIHARDPQLDHREELPIGYRVTARMGRIEDLRWILRNPFEEVDGLDREGPAHDPPQGPQVSERYSTRETSCQTV